MIDPNLQRIIDMNKKFREPLKREKKASIPIAVRYTACKHTKVFQSDDPHAPVWVVGAERVDEHGRRKALESYGECPECLSFSKEVDATSVPTRDANGDPGTLQTGDSKTGS